VKREPVKDILARLRSNARQGLVTTLLPHEARAVARVARADSVSTSSNPANLSDYACPTH
jgi:hypothetical protein